MCLLPALCEKACCRDDEVAWRISNPHSPIPWSLCCLPNVLLLYSQVRRFLKRTNATLRNRGIVISYHVRYRVNCEPIAHRLKVKIYNPIGGAGAIN